jgi:hypothetical protein
MRHAPADGGASAMTIWKTQSAEKSAVREGHRIVTR